MVLVDSNVLLDISTDDATWRAWSERALRDALVAGGAGVDPIIYAETSPAFADAALLDRSPDALLPARLPLQYGSGFLAGRAFLRYRRVGSARESPLPDSCIGARAATDDLTLVTRDVGRYRMYFPAVLVAPGDHA